jgi:hypothetical protein
MKGKAMLNVEIRVKNHLDPHWSEWLECLNIDHTEENQTVLTGTVPDESALYGVLTKLRNLGLALVSVSSTEIAETPLTTNKEDG